MAGNATLYSLMYATVGNTLLVEEQNLELKRVGQGQIVNTVAKRFSGISPGASMCTINVTNAHPAAGPEVDFGEAIDGYLPTEIGIVRGDGKTAKSVGFVMEDEFKHGVNQEAVYSFTFIGPFPRFE